MYRVSLACLLFNFVANFHWPQKRVDSTEWRRLSPSNGTPGTRRLESASFKEICAKCVSTTKMYAFVNFIIGVECRKLRTSMLCAVNAQMRRTEKRNREIIFTLGIKKRKIP